MVENISPMCFLIIRVGMAYVGNSLIVIHHNKMVLQKGITGTLHKLLIIGSDSLAKTLHVKILLEEEFNMKDLREVHYVLGIEIIHTKEAIWLSQRQYALDMLSKYGMAACKPIAMPLY